MLSKVTLLTALTLQTSFNVLLIRYTRHSTPEDETYLPSTSVLLTEIVKLIVGLSALIAVSNGSLEAAWQWFKRDILMDPIESLKLLIPGGLYAMQNNLLYLALTHLDAATYQITYQLKLLTTALCSCWLLGRRLVPLKWLALSILTMGVILVQLPGNNSDERSTDNLGSGVLWTSRLYGVCCVLMACMTSGLSGVYFEKLVKRSQQTSLIIRNLQLSLVSVPMAMLPLISTDREAIVAQGFLHGYTLTVYFLIVFQAMGGLMVAVTVKYADNIAKGFAASLSILLSSLLSWLVFDEAVFTFSFGIGASLVIVATVLYNLDENFFNSKKDKSNNKKKSGL